MSAREVTFFGEVAGLTSRATWDVDEDDDAEMGSGDTELTLSNQITFAPIDFVPTPSEVVYLSLTNDVKKIPCKAPIAECFVTSQPEMCAKIIDLGNAGKMIVIGTPPTKRDSWLSVLMIQELLSKFIGNTGLFVILTVIPSEKKSTENIWNSFVAGKKEARQFCRGKALPPTIVSSVYEAAAFEYCTVQEKPACLVMVPSLEAVEDVGSYPEEVKSCLKCLLTPPHLNSNIYI